MCHETNVLLKFQGCISIFDLVTEEKRRSGYLGDVALTGHDTSFPPRCKSKIIAIITSATKLMSCPNSIYISIFDLVTEEKRRSGDLGDVALIGRDNSFSCRCKSEIICIITSDTKLMSNPISRVTSEHLT